MVPLCRQDHADLDSGRLWHEPGTFEVFAEQTEELWLAHVAATSPTKQ